jgi:uncharacterized membrane protein YedE/YeeE
MMEAIVRALGGGALIGLASILLFASLGRIAGIAGIASHAVAPAQDEPAATGRWRWWFLLGLVGTGGLLAPLSGGTSAALPPWPVLLVSAALVGFGTVIGSGCTSGHGVCGLGRLSMRSLVSVAIFMAIGMVVASVALS